MLELLPLQQRFLQWLMVGEPSLADDICDDGRVPLEVRLGIYRNAYQLRLIEALTDGFPALHTLLGDVRFESLARAYVDAHPSEYRSIRWFGDRMTEFLGTEGYADQPLLSEMAAFEWALRGALDAADAQPLARSTLTALPTEDWARLRLDFHPSLTRLDLEWNVPQLWRAIDAEAEPIPAQRAEFPIPWMVWRKELSNWFRSLEVDEAWALDHMREGGDFSSLCAGLTEWIDEANVPMRAAGFVATWLDEGLLLPESGAF